MTKDIKTVNRNAERIPAFIDQAFLLSKFIYVPETGEIIRKKTGRVTGSLSTNGYLRTSIGYTRISNHWIVWMMHHGEWPSDQIDHINRIPTDNRIENLRLSNYRLNALNRGTSTRNKSGFVGVHLDRSKWCAMITRNAKAVYLGNFDTKEEAHAAYMAAREVRVEELVANNEALARGHVRAAIAAKANQSAQEK